MIDNHLDTEILDVDKLTDNEKALITSREHIGLSNALIGEVLDNVTNPYSLTQSEAVGVLCQLKAYRRSIVIAKQLKENKDKEDYDQSIRDEAALNS